MTTHGDPPSDVRPRIAVIGGGITGLAAAHRVHELLPIAELCVFEAGPRVGGMLETLHRDGFLIERSADSYLTRLPQAVALCNRLGLVDELISTDETRRRAFVVHRGQLVPIPEAFHLMSPQRLGPILRSPMLSALGKLRLLAERFVPRGPASVDLNQADESVAGFARRRFGREVFERLVQPLVAGIYTADPEQLSMAATMPEFLAQERDYGSLLAAARHRKGDRVSDQCADDSSGARYSLFVTFKSGLNTLVEGLVARLPANAIRLNIPVASIQQTPESRWQLDFGLPGRTGNPQSSFDAVILAVPAFVAGKLVEREAPALSAELTSIDYAGCNVVSLGFKRGDVGHALDGFGFVVPQIEHRRLIAASFASQKFPGRAPDDSVLIRTFVGGALQPEMADLSDRELRRLALEEFGDLLQINGQPLFADVARWPRSMPQYHVGHVGRVARIEKLAERHPRLALAGNAYHGVGIPQCIASGESAAERVLAAFR